MPKVTYADTKNIEIKAAVVYFDVMEDIRTKLITAEAFTISRVKYFYSENYTLMVYKAVESLVAAGIVTEVAKGVYVLNKD